MRVRLAIEAEASSTGFVASVLCENLGRVLDAPADGLDLPARSLALVGFHIDEQTEPAGSLRLVRGVLEFDVLDILGNGHLEIIGWEPVEPFCFRPVLAQVRDFVDLSKFGRVTYED